MTKTLLDELNFNVETLKEICPSIFNTPSTGTSLGTLDKNDVNLVNIDNEDYFIAQRKYYEKVEEGNQYIKELMKLEMEYFNKKYGPDIYRHIKNKRNQYERDQLNQKCNFDLYDLSFDELKTDLSKNIMIYNDLMNSNKSNKVQTLKDHIDSVGNDITNMVNETERNKRKVEYRNEVSDDVLEYSVYSSYIYYFVVLCIFIFLFVQNALNLKKNAVVYIVVLIFPFVFRYVFLAFVYVYNIINEKFDLHGPKNAFLDQNTDFAFFDDYDI